MRVVDLRVLTKERGLRGYSRMRKAELIAFLQELRTSPTPIPPSTRPPLAGPEGPPWSRAPLGPPRPSRPPQPPPSVRFRQDRPRQEMDILEQWEMRKNRPVVTSKLNDWYDWLVSHVPKAIKDNVSRAFKSFKIMGLYNRVTGNQTQRQKIEELKGPCKPKPFNPIELEQAFNGAYRSYRVNGRPRMDVDTFFSRIRGELISLITRELTDLNSARVQTTVWIRFTQDDDRVELAFNSRMTDVHRGSDLDVIMDGMIAHMKMQIENPALLNRRFRFDEVLFLDANFHWLNFTRGSSYLSYQIG